MRAREVVVYVAAVEHGIGISVCLERINLMIGGDCFGGGREISLIISSVCDIFHFLPFPVLSFVTPS